MRKYTAMRFSATWGTAFVVSCVTALATYASIAIPQELPTHSGIFGIRLETSKKIYRVGEPVEVRISVHNETSDVYEADSVPPWGLCDLTILSSGGQALPAADVSRAVRRSSIAIREYLPGSTHSIGYDTPEAPGIFHDWADISHWGYDIKEPGEYTIAAIPEVRGFARTGPNKGAYFISSSSDKSATVRIKVVK